MRFTESSSQGLSDWFGRSRVRAIIRVWPLSGLGSKSETGFLSVFSQGYKKGLDIKKAFLAEGLSEEAEKWTGHHTGIKPAVEDWWLIRKPISGRVIDNLLKYGTGALNIDSARIYTDWNEEDRPDSWKKSGYTSKPEAAKVAAPPGQGIECHPLGRWPADFVLSHSLGCRRVGFKMLKGDSAGEPGREASRRVLQHWLFPW